MFIINTSVILGTVGTESSSSSSCPVKKTQDLTSFPSGSDVVLSGGIRYILDRNVSLNSITITNGGKNGLNVAFDLET